MDSAKVHELKTDPEHYNDVEAGHKTHTVRVDDRMYSEGDYVILRKTKYTGKDMAEGQPLVYMGSSIMCKITHIYDGPGTEEGFVVLSLKIVDRFPGRVM